MQAAAAGRRIVVAAGLGVAGLVAGWSGPAEAFRNVALGDVAPRFQLLSTEQQPVALESDRPAVVLFLKGGQEKSVEALEDLAELDDEVRQGLQLLAVVTDPEEGDLAPLVAAAGDLPLALDRGNEVYALYGIKVLPATAVIDAGGVLRAELSGHASGYGDLLERELRAMLGMEVEASAAEAAVPEKSEARKEAERYLQKAKLLGKRRMGSKALEAAREAAQVDPTFVEAQVMAGTLLLEESPEATAEAGQYFAKALELDPKNLDAQVGAARVRSAGGDYEGAVEVLERAAQLNPHPEEMYYQLGQIHQQAGQFERAAEAYRKALERLLR